MARNGNYAPAEPYRKLTTITPSDVTTYDPPLDGVLVGGVGNLTVKDGAGQTVLLTAVPAGTLLPIEVSQIHSTGTTATLITGLNW